MNLLQQAFSHSVPNAIQRFPQSLKLVHWGQSLLYSRNRTIKRWVKQATSTCEGAVLDVGCGDGHYLFQLKKAKVKRVIAMDRNADWLNFLSDFQSKNTIVDGLKVEFRTENLDDDFLAGEKGLDLIFCFSVLPYLKDPGHVFERFSALANPGCRLLVYSPVAFDTILPLYRWMFARFQHYESVQSRKELLSASALTQLALNHGFVLKSAVSTYGFWGKLGHECWSMSTMLLGASSILLRMVGVLSIPITLPMNLGCGFVDRRSETVQGNGWMASFERI